jgi:tetratricopeptide (TPR) repeat protein
MALGSAAAATADFQFDEGQRHPTPIELPSKAERQAEAMARFITGMFEEENAGPEQALDSYRKVLTLDPGFTKLAIDVAYDYLRRGDSTEAIGVLKDAIKASPEEPGPALALSSIYLRHLRKPDLAAKYAEGALKVAPKTFGPYEALWEIAQAQGDTREAAHVLDRAARSRSTDSAFWLQLAEFYSNPAQGEGAIDERMTTKISTTLEKATACASDDAEQLASVAEFYVLSRQYAKAVPLYRKAAELKPTLPGINEKLAGTLIETGDMDAALPVLERIVVDNPLDLRAYKELSKLYSDRGEYRKALTCVEQTLIIDKADPARYAQLADLLFLLQEFKTAAERLAEARRLFPQAVLFTYMHAKALSLAGQHDEAMNTFERALVEASSSQPDLLDGHFYLDYGIAAEAAGRYVKAAELLKKAIEVDPSSAAAAYNALGYMWVEHDQNLDEAEQLIRRALELEPGNGAFIDSLGWLHYKKGRYEDALRELLNASKSLEQPDAVVCEHIGDAYRALNRTAEAMLYWQKAAQLDPGNKPLLTKIDRETEKIASKPGPGQKAPEPPAPTPQTPAR